MEFVQQLVYRRATCSVSVYCGHGIRTRYFGHACVLLESPTVSILVDPIISYDYDTTLPRYTYSDLPDSIDYVLITHNHQDHISIETMLQIRRKTGAVIVPRNSGGSLADPSLKLMLQQIGFPNVIDLDELETIEFSNGAITGIPFMGEHCDIDVRSKLVYHIVLGEWRVVLAADSCNIDPKVYEHVHDFIGDIDVLFIGMECDGAPLSWMYGPLLPNPLERKMDNSRTLSGSNFRQAFDLVSRFNCKEVYVYAMGMEPWLKYITTKQYTKESDPIIQSNQLIEACRQQHKVAERLFGEKEILVSG